AEIIIDKLRKEKFVDDARYAKSYVSEKWNLDHWGRIKIENNLIQKQIPEDVIRQSLSDIDEDDYKIFMEDLLKNKLKEVRSDNFMDDARRVHMYAVSKGFEEELVREWLENQE
ncbi:MAG: RecX family transcriptional regulator, partial [Bacteroidota bacterium]|nr:RecX family transcriptional regulator [Bacteroidota bacterium]